MVNGEIVRFVIHFIRTGASAVQCVFHGEYAGGGGSDTEYMENLAAWLLAEDGPLDFWSSIASNTVEADRLTAQVLNLDGTVDRNLETQALDLIGGVLFDSMAAATSGQIKFDTGEPGHRGMKYVPGIADPRINLGLIDGTGLLGLVAMGDALLDLELEGSGLKTFLGVLSRGDDTFRRFIRSVATTSNPIYQRRRGPGRGL